jgi:hypothetical protein
MKINDLRSGLSAAAELLDGIHPTEGQCLRQFSAALQCSKSIKTAEAVDKILANWAASARHPSYPIALRDTLTQLTAMQAAFGASSAAADLKALLGLFEGSPDQSASDFCRDIAEGLANPAKKPAARKASADKGKALPVTSLEVNSIADQLVALAENHEAFNQLLATLAADKRMTKIALVSVASRFLGYDTKPKSKDAALEAIRRRQMQDAIQGARAREVQKIAV